MGVNHHPLQLVVAHLKRPFHEYVANRFIFSMFDTEDFPERTNLVSQMFEIMRRLNQQRSEVLNMETVERIDYYNALIKIPEFNNSE